MNYPSKILQKWILSTLLRCKRMHWRVKNLTYFLEGLLISTTLPVSSWIRTLKQKGETQTTAEPAKKRKSLSTGDDSDSEEFGAYKLLAANKWPKLVADNSNGSTCETSSDSQSGSLLNDITPSLTDTEKTHRLIIADYAYLLTPIQAGSTCICSWIFTRVTEELNQGLPRNNSN